MILTKHVIERREASTDIIEKEIKSGFQIENDLARTILGRFKGLKRFKDTDKYILRKDLQGVYVLSLDKTTNSRYVAVTYIDLTSMVHQDILTRLFGSEHPILSVTPAQNDKYNEKITYSDFFIQKYWNQDLNDLNNIIITNVKRKTKYPALFIFEHVINEKTVKIRVFKKSTASNIRVSVIS